jgi:hypothetical protein
MNTKNSEERKLPEFLALIKVIFDCPYENEIFLEGNFDNLEEFSLKNLYPITFLLKNNDPGENFNSPNNTPILYFPSSQKISVKIKEEKPQPMCTSFVKFKTKIIFKRNPGASLAKNSLIGGEISIMHDYNKEYGIKNTYLNIFTLFELILSIKDKETQNRIINTLNNILKERFDLFLKMKREKITSISEIKKKVYEEHFDYFEGLDKIKNFYQEKTVLSGKKRKAKILIDGFCEEKAMAKALKRAFSDLIIFYKVFFTDIILN